MAQPHRFRLPPVLPSMASRSSSHRAQLGVARSAHEAPLRKRLASPFKKLCFLSAAPIRNPPSAWVTPAIHGAEIVASPIPSLAIHGKPFDLQKALLFVGCADQEPAFGLGDSCHPWRGNCGFANPQSCHPWQAVRPSKSFAFCRLRRSGLTLELHVDFQLDFVADAEGDEAVDAEG